MPLRTYLILITVVLAAAGTTVALVFALGINMAWLGLAALVLAYVVHTVAS